MKVGNIIVSVIFFCFMLLIFILALQIPSKPIDGGPGPGYIPLIYSSIGMLLSLGIFINSIREKTSEKFYLSNHFFLFILIITGYAILIPILNYYIATIIFIIIILLIMGARKLSLILLLPLIYSVFIFMIFEKVMGIPMP